MEEKREERREGDGICIPTPSTLEQEVRAQLMVSKVKNRLNTKTRLFTSSTYLSIHPLLLPSLGTRQQTAQIDYLRLLRHRHRPMISMKVGKAWLLVLNRTWLTENSEVGPKRGVGRVYMTVGESTRRR